MSAYAIRPAREADLDAIGEMFDDFVHDHPSRDRPRPREHLREAYFGAKPVAHLLVAERGAEVAGMVQWQLFFDAFWSMFAGRAEYLYVRPQARNLGLSAALLAEVCAAIRRAGGEYLAATYSAELAPLYERVIRAWPTRDGALSAEAFHTFADLAGKPPREIVRGLPTPDLNQVPARPR